MFTRFLTRSLSGLSSCTRIKCLPSGNSGRDSRNEKYSNIDDVAGVHARYGIRNLTLTKGAGTPAYVGDEVNLVDLMDSETGVP